MKKYLLISIICAAVCLQQSCSLADSSTDVSSESGAGGSMARFTIVDNSLYTVDNENMDVFDISSEESPEYSMTTPVGWGVETIFPLGDKLFLGTSSGMFIYDISNEGEPEKISFYEHVIACDPVVSDGDFAYVTLSASRQSCWRSVNELQIIDIQNIQQPQLLRQYSMTNPRGLAIRNDTLWLCDDGLKIYDVSDKQNIKRLYYFEDLEAYDIILDKSRALVIGETGFVQYKLENDTIQKLSEIKISN